MLNYENSFGKLAQPSNIFAGTAKKSIMRWTKVQNDRKMSLIQLKWFEDDYQDIELQKVTTKFNTFPNITL